MRISVLIPCYNERETILEIVRRVKATGLNAEIVIVDDGSTDGSRTILEGLKDDHCKVVLHDRNRGKGAAIRTGLTHVTSEIVVVQDADLEYDPRDLGALVEPISAGTASVVYGSRNLRANKYSYSTFYWGGRLVSWLTNLIYRSRITDEPTGYKMFHTNVLRSLDLRSQRFEFCAEVTAKLLRRGYRIVEVPITYSPRGFAEGKKIRWTDGLQAIWVLIRVRLFG